MTTEAESDPTPEPPREPTPSESRPESPPASPPESPREPPSESPRRRLRVSVLVGLGIFVLALVLRLVHLSELMSTEFFDERDFVGDARYYDMRAGEIAHGDFFGEAPGYLSPTYCNALGLLYALPGFGLVTAKLVQAILGAFSALLLYLLGRRLFGEPAGILAGLFASVYGLFIYYSGVLLPATLLLFLHLLLLWVLIAKPMSLARAIVVGLLVGLSIGTKANALLLLPVIAGWMLFGDRNGERETKLARRSSWVVALLLGSFVTLAPITYRNYVTSGEFVLVTTTGGRNLLKGNGPTANGTHVELELRRRTSTLGTYLAGKTHALAAVREDDRLRDMAIEYMRENPRRTAELWGRKLLMFFNRAELGIRDSYPFARTQTRLLAAPLLDFGWIVPFGLAGLLLLATRSRDTKLLALVTATQVASFVLVFVLARYRVVAVAMLLVFAGGFFVDLYRSLAQRNFKRSLVALLLVALSFGLVHYPIEGVPEEPTTGEQLEYLGDQAQLRGEYQTAIDYYEEASDARFAIDQAAGRWRMRVSIGECLVPLGRAAEARDLWSRLYYDISDRKSASAEEIRDLIRENLAELDASEAE